MSRHYAKVLFLTVAQCLCLLYNSIPQCLCLLYNSRYRQCLCLSLSSRLLVVESVFGFWFTIVVLAVDNYCKPGVNH
jgi:hypothetical protein